jgi:hypothetical protein
VRGGPPARLRGDHEVAGVVPFAQEAADQPFAAAVAVHVGGVDEAHAGIRCRVQRRERVGVGDLAPVTPELPRAEADRGHVAAGAAERASFHGRGGRIRTGGLLLPKQAR